MLRLVLLLAFLFATAVLAQDAKDEDADAATESSEQTPKQAAEQTPDDAGLDDLDDLDELYPVEDEDAFIPSENVAFGQSIPFPTDI